MLQESMLLIGIGNPLRGDDRAGWVLAEQAGAVLTDAGWAVTVRLVQQLTPELAEELAELRPGVVLFADAAAGQAAPRLVALGGVEPGGETGSSHHLGPLELLAICRKLYGFDCPAWLVTTPAVAFAHGEELSAVAVAGVAAAVALLKEARFAH